MHWERVDLALSFSVLKTCRPQSPRRPPITHDPLPTVWGDPDCSRDYISAYSVTRSNFAGTSPVIHLTAALQELQVVLGIQDNGIGIKPEYHEHIFTSFKRLHGRGKYARSGIGLTVCRKIVERHGGHIWVESHLGQGAHFKFTLFHHTVPSSLLLEAFNPAYPQA